MSDKLEVLRKAAEHRDKKQRELEEFFSLRFRLKYLLGRTGDYFKKVDHIRIQ